MTATTNQDFNFACPKCRRAMVGDRALLGELITCPDCGESFQPAPERVPLAPKQVAVAKAWLQKKQATGPEAIRNLARAITRAALILLGIALLCIFVAVAGALDGGAISYGGVYGGAACLGSAFWLMLLAQLMHIRANTEK